MSTFYPRSISSQSQCTSNYTIILPVLILSGGQRLFQHEFANRVILGVLFLELHLGKQYSQDAMVCEEGILENWTPKMPCLVKRGYLGNQYCQDHPCSQQKIWSLQYYPTCHNATSWKRWYPPERNKLWYNVMKTDFGRNLIMDKRWPNVWFLWVQTVSNFYPGAEWPAHKWKNCQFQSLTRLRLPIILSILDKSDDKKRTKVRPQGQILDLMRTNLGFWGQLLVKYRKRT